MEEKWKNWNQLSLAILFLLIIDCDTVTYGPNLLVNSGFQTPSFDTKEEFNYTPVNFTGWMPANTSSLVSIPYICLHYDTNYCQIYSLNQVISLSFFSSQSLTQIVQINQNATYLLSFQWILASPNRTNKSVTVIINSYVIATFSVNNSNINAVLSNQSVELNLTPGSNNITFVMNGISGGKGIYLDNVYLQKITTENVITNPGYFKNSVTMALSAMINNSVTSTTNKMPGSRVFLSQLLTFNINLDRLQFYFYHKQNFTQYAYIFLSAIFIFKDQQGSLLQILIEDSKDNSTVCKTIDKAQNTIESRVSYKSNYANQYFLTKNQNGDGFSQNVFHFFYYEVPSIILGFFLLWAFFHLFREYRFSVCLRKYCFLGLMLSLLFEGNLEQFSFYCLRQFHFYFSANLSHKFLNAFILGFFFIIIFYVFGSMLYFFAIYSRKAKYLLQGYRFRFAAIIVFSIDCGFFPLCSGIIHGLFLQNLLAITVLLVLMEFSWLLLRVRFVREKLYASKPRTVISIINNGLRIIFAVTLYLYQISEDDALYNVIHFAFVVSYLLLWAIDLLICLCHLVLFAKYLCKNRINPIEEVRHVIDDNILRKMQIGEDKIKIEEAEAPLHQNSIRKFILRKKRESRTNEDCPNAMTVKRRKILKTRFQQIDNTMHSKQPPKRE